MNTCKGHCKDTCKGHCKDTCKEQSAQQVSQHIANVRANNPEYREESRAQDATARAHRRRSERIRNLERIRDAEAHAERRQNLDYRVPERNRDMEARAARREDPEERRREQDSEEHAREQERNTEEHRQRRRNPEERQREREMGANNRRAIRRNPIARSQEQRMNTSQRRETRQQRRIREEQIRQMAEDRLINFRMDPQNRLDASQRQSQRNMDARAELSEDEMEQERELQRHRIRSSARDLYHRNIKEGPTEICVCCGGTWFRSQDYDEANDLEVDVEDEVAEQNYPLMDGSGYVKKRKHPLILRWVRFSINSSPSDYFREHLMLFYPWRNEEAELLSNDVENTFRTNHESIRIMKRNYDVFDDMELERVLEDLQEDRGDNNPNLEEPASQFLDEEFRALAVPNIERNVNILQDDNATNNPEEDGELQLIRLPPTEELSSRVPSRQADRVTVGNADDRKIPETSGIQARPPKAGMLSRHYKD
ncbi:golgin subfamily A member 6-like protein 22 [Drosophila ananassae]|uniref:golgin subfamily A member 6-like protein 22 n=1 Tax=Drosophila ananassae TaxID=7217 RepID=UPI001CFFA71A|nr:golgin subfamily A member 6-like protein 22 [Drosophila ananassae]